jgi:hypothetical protein
MPIEKGRGHAALELGASVNLRLSLPAVEARGRRSQMETAEARA